MQNKRDKMSLSGVVILSETVDNGGYLFNRLTMPSDFGMITNGEEDEFCTICRFLFRQRSARQYR